MRERARRPIAMKAPVFPAKHWLGVPAPTGEADSVPAKSLFSSRTALALTIVATSVMSAHAVRASSVPAASALAPAVSVVRRPPRGGRAGRRHGHAGPPRRDPRRPGDRGLRITELLVEEGDRVAKGQVLARLSREMIETQEASNAAAIARAEAAIVQARSQIVQAEAAQTEAKLVPRARPDAGPRPATPPRRRWSSGSPPRRRRKASSPRRGAACRPPRPTSPRPRAAGNRDRPQASPAPRSGRPMPASSTAAPRASAQPRPRSASRCSG